MKTDQERLAETILDNIGITLRMDEIPEYVAYAKLRDDLGMIHPIRRWLSFRKRKELERLGHRANSAILHAVLQAGESCLTNP